jgi:hypothetical protein
MVTVSTYLKEMNLIPLLNLLAYADKNLVSCKDFFGGKGYMMNAEKEVGKVTSERKNMPGSQIVYG